MISYFSQYNKENGVEVVKLILDILDEWKENIDKLEKNHKNNEENNKLPILKLQKCLFHMYGIIALGGNRKLSRDELNRLCKIIIEMKNEMVDGGKESEEYQKVQNLKSYVYSIIVQKLNELISFIKQSPEYLTSIVIKMTKTLLVI